MEEGVTGSGKLTAALRRMIVGIGEVSMRWLAVPVGDMSLLSIGPGIILATIDAPRKAPLRAEIWLSIGAFMLISGYELALAHAGRQLPQAKSPLGIFSASVWIIVIAGSLTSNHDASL